MGCRWKRVSWFFVAGAKAVTNLGHGNKVVDAIKAQAEKLIHTSNMYYIEPQVKLAEC